MGRWITSLLVAFSFVAVAAAAAEQPAVAIIMQDRVSLRPAPRDSAKAHAMLWQGEVVEVRGERLDYLQVYDHRRERAGFVRASEARRLSLSAEDAPELFAIVRFLRDVPGAESLGIGFAASYIQAAPAEVLNSESGIEVLDTLGTLAQRLAHRASAGTAPSQAAQMALSGHLDAALRHGVVFTNYERNARVRICYDGDAFRRVLAMPSNPEQRARAALALTRLDCIADEQHPAEQRRMNEWRAEVLDRVDTNALRGYLKNRVLMRRAAIWSGLAYQYSRQGAGADVAAQRALVALSGVNKAELTEADTQIYNHAAMRVSASRWAAMPRPAAPDKGLQVVTIPGEPGETCVLLLNQAKDTAHPLAKRCSYGIVWLASASANREGTALALAVQPTDTWRELWVFRKSGPDWTVRVLPPDTTAPEIGYAEFAGWVPGGAQMLVAREASGEGKYRHSFEVLSLNSFGTMKQASDPSRLSVFRRWQDATWKTQTLSLR